MASRLVRKLHSSAYAAGLPALGVPAGVQLKQPGLWDKLLGASAVPVLPPMSEPLTGVAIPQYVAPTAAPKTTLKKLANGSIIAAEETPVRHMVVRRSCRVPSNKWDQLLSKRGIFGTVSGRDCVGGYLRRVWEQVRGREAG